MAAASVLAGCGSVSPPGFAARRGGEAEPGAAYIAGDLLGLSAPVLESAFGAPALTRREGEGEFRRYSFETCALLVFLYPNDAGVDAVRHLDATALSGDAPRPSVDSCLQDPKAPRKAG